MREVRASVGESFWLADADSHVSSGAGPRVIRLAEHYEVRSTILHVELLQRLACNAVTARCKDMDQPRNLSNGLMVWRSVATPH